MSLKRLIVPFLFKVFLSPFWRVGILLLFLNHYAVIFCSVTNSEAFLILHGWVESTDWPRGLVSQNGMDECRLGMGLIEIFFGGAASCCFQIIVNLKKCFCLWLLLGDRNNLDSSYDNEASQWELPVLFSWWLQEPRQHLQAPWSRCPLVSLQGQASQNLEFDCTQGGLTSCWMITGLIKWIYAGQWVPTISTWMFTQDNLLEHNRVSNCDRKCMLFTFRTWNKVCVCGRDDRD